ncbi:hypothetical protein V8E53_000517 [Lactarius tabidus]
MLRVSSYSGLMLRYFIDAIPCLMWYLKELLDKTKAPSILQSPVFRYWATVSLWSYAYTCSAFPFLRFTFAVVPGLAASLSYGAASKCIRHSTVSTTDPTDPPTSLMKTEANLTHPGWKLKPMHSTILKVHL